MTETSPIGAVCTIKSTLDDLDDEAKADLRTTIGLIAPAVDFRIAEPETGEEIPWDGETSGELQVRGPWVARTYYNDDRAPESFTDDGWLKTGDVATADPEGYIRLVDRTKDLIKSGGEWISSVELENEIMAHPDVVEAAVIGKPDPERTELVKAFVVLAKGVAPSEALAEELSHYVKQRLSAHAYPREIAFVAELPKTPSGKLQRFILRNQEIAKAAEAGKG